MSLKNVQMYLIKLMIISYYQSVVFADYPSEADYGRVPPGVPPQAYSPPTQHGNG